MGFSLRHYVSLALTLCMHFVVIAWIGLQWESYRDVASSRHFDIVTVALHPVFDPTLYTPLADPQVYGGALASANSGIPGSLQRSENLHSAEPASLPTSPVYFTYAELDQRPSPLKPIIIDFPSDVLNEGRVEGILLLYIGLNGKVERVETIQSTSFPSLDHAAKEAFMRGAMQPGIKDGKAVRSQMKVAVEFEAL